MSMLIYRQAIESDIPDICRFTDYWLAGRGLKDNAPGAVNDYFVSPSQHKKYVTKYLTYLCLEDGAILAWSVMETSRTLIHLLVAGNRRCLGIGKRMVSLLRPKVVRCKTDQSSGNPGPFYEKLGYKQVELVRSESRLDINRLRPNRGKNIAVYVKP